MISDSTVNARTDRIDEVECELLCLLKTQRCRMPTTTSIDKCAT